MSVQGRKTRSPGYIEGSHWVRCTRCDFIVRKEDIRIEWTKAIVCKDCWEPRHPQDFVRAKSDDMRAKGPVNPDITVQESLCGSFNAVCDIAVSDCSICDYGLESIVPQGTFQQGL